MVVLLGIVLTACQQSALATPTVASANPTPTLASANTPVSAPERATIERGRGLYASQGCYVCHGERGEGNIGPALASTSLTFAEVRRQLRSPRGFMPVYIPEILSDDQIRDLYAFERSLPKP